MQGCRRSWEDKLKCVKILSVKGHYSAKICPTCLPTCLPICPTCLPTCTSRLLVQHLYQASYKSMQGCRSCEDKLKCVKILSVKGHYSAKICPTCLPTCLPICPTCLPTCTSRLVVQHPCQVSYKSIEGYRRRWEDNLKCVKILSVKGHNSAKICWTWIIILYALLYLWCNICTKFHSNPCKDAGGVEKTS